MERPPALNMSHSHSGFSLVEMLIIVVIIGMTVALVAPKINLAHYQIDGAMQSIGFQLMAAQREAISQQHDVIVEFDAPNRALIIIDDNNNNRAIDAGERSRTYTLESLVRFGRASAAALSFGSADITFTQTVNGLPSVTFHRNGAASQDGAVYLTSTRASAGDVSRQVDTRAVAVDRPTGRIEWWRYDGSAWHQGF
jgi:Tfp pilus assembly protein FimT